MKTAELKIAFVDRDGTLIFEPPATEQADSLEALQILPGAIAGLTKLVKDGYKLVMVSNQDGLGMTAYPKKKFDIVQKELLKQLKKEGIDFYGVFVCPHSAKDNCACRKPKIGLVKEFMKKNEIDKLRSFVIGDRATDMGLANNLGVRGFLMKTNGLFSRIATVERNTKETSIFVQCNLDGTGNYSVETGLGFFNHMLEQFSKHSLIDLTVIARGDLHIDEHHTIEDVGLALGETLAGALGDRAGIKRYGFLLPMDDTLVEVAVDLGGRPYLVFECKFAREKVGDLPTEMVEHFFRSLAETLKANIHINVRYSKSEHHKIEAIFKSFAKTLRMAVEKDARSSALPTTKGHL